MSLQHCYKYFLQNFFSGSSQPINWLKRPWILVSLGLHGVLLLVPLSTSSPEPVTETVSLVEPSVLPSTPVALSTQPPIPSPQPSLQVSPVPAPIAISPSPILATPTPLPIVPSPVASPTPVATSMPEPIESPAPSPVASPTPEVATSPSPIPTPEVELPSANFPADFPHIVSATAGCHNSDQCWHSSDTQWRSIAGTLRENLQAQGYTVAEMPIADDTGRRVYQVEKPGQPAFYLNLISTFEGTLYLITEVPMSAEEINQLVSNEG